MIRISPYRHFLILCIILFAGNSVYAQTKFYARADAKEVLENGVFNIEFTIENGQGSNFQAPPFTNFEVLSGPSSTMSTTIINGRRSSSQSFSFSLLAKEVGTKTIGPATIRTNGQNLSSNSVVVKVVKSDGKNVVDGQVMPTDEDIFIRAEIDSTPVFPGQQITLNYRIFTSVNIRDFSTLGEDTYTDFYIQYLRNFDRRSTQVVINGRQFTTQIVKSVALFPQKTGAYRIKPMTANIWIPKPGAVSRSFFSRGTTINKRIVSNAVDFMVDPLPEPLPSSFSGAIGKYQMQVTINKKTITQDEALVLEMTVKGDGDSKRWTAPEFDLEAFEIYDPNITYDEINEENGKIVNLKKFEYLMLPKRTGTLQFQVPFTYYDIDSLKYLSYVSQRLSAVVTPGTGKRIPTDLESAKNAEAGEDLAFREIKKLSKRKGTFLFSPLYFFIGLIPFLFLGFVWYKERDKNIFAQLDPNEKRRRAANKKALRRMEKAHQLLEGDSTKEYYNSIATAIYGYISDKLQIPISKLSKETVSSRVNQLNISEERKAELINILKTCELNVYAGMAGGNRKEIYVQTLGLITELESAIDEV